MTKDFSNGKIYMLQPICDHEEGDIYIGSTIRPLLCQRMVDHRKDYKSWKNGKKKFISSFSLFEKYSIDRMRIILLETYPCNNNDELRAREAYYQKSMKCINKVIAFRSKEENQEYLKQYREVHKEYLKQYREVHKEYFKQYREVHKEDRKQYLEENKEKISEQMKEYYEEHKQEILEKYKELITCECGRQLTKQHLKRHQRSDIHKELTKQLHDVENKNDAI